MLNMHWHNSGGTLLVVSAVELMMQGNCAMACAYAAFTGRVEWFQKFLADAETAGFELSAAVLDSRNLHDDV